MIEQQDRDRLNQCLGRIDADVDLLSDLPNTHQKAVLLDKFASIKNDILMILKRCEEGMTIDEAAKDCKFYERIVIDN